MTDKQHITIHIADAAPLDLHVQRDKEASVRKVEKDVNLLYAQWRETFKDLSPREVLAMVAFRYAQVYYDLAEKIKDDEEGLANAEKTLDRLLLDIK